MLRPAAVLIMTSLALYGCAAAMPGYVPPNPKTERMKAAAPKGGGFDPDGSYSLTDQEQKLDCKHLSGSMTVKIYQMREAGERTDASTSAKWMAKGMKPFKNTTSYGLDVSEDYKRDRARLEALNAQLVAKGCKSFDLDAELKPGYTETPKPTIEAKK